MPNDPFFKGVKVNANNSAAKRLLENEKAKEVLQVQKEQRTVERGRVNFREDFNSGQALGDQIVGDGLGRLNGNEQIENTREQLRGLTAGPTSAENTSRRESALEGINAQAQSSNRQLLGSLSAAGVKGGVAAAGLGQVQNQAILERRRLERDITADQAASSRSATENLAAFETDLTKFDISQDQAEKNIRLQTGLASAQLGSIERATLRSTEAQLAAADKSGGGGKK